MIKRVKLYIIFGHNPFTYTGRAGVISSSKWPKKPESCTLHKSNESSPRDRMLSVLFILFNNKLKWAPSPVLLHKPSRWESHAWCYFSFEVPVLYTVHTVVTMGKLVANLGYTEVLPMVSIFQTIGYRGTPPSSPSQLRWSSLRKSVKNPSLEKNSRKCNSFSSRCHCEI
jgi:hypothetical protein